MPEISDHYPSHPWVWAGRTDPELTVSLSASTADEAAAAMRQVYHDLTVSAPVGGLNMRLHCVDLAKARLVGLTMGHSTVVTEGCPYYVVATTVSGKALLTTSGNTRAIPHLDQAVIVPGDPLQVSYLASASEMMTILFDPAALEDELSALLGRAVSSPIRFDDAPRRCDDLGPFHRVLLQVGQELTGPSVIVDRPQMASYYVRLLMAGLLLDHRHSYSEELARAAGFTGPRAVRSAVNVIESDPMGVASVVDLARRANVSVRSLEDGFRAHMGTSPMRYLRDTRLVHAHEALRRSDPEATTATAIAHRWGFNHYGRFASEYRARFGRTPAETLRSG